MPATRPRAAHARPVLGAVLAAALAGGAAAAGAPTEAAAHYGGCAAIGQKANHLRILVTVATLAGESEQAVAYDIMANSYADAYNACVSG